MKQKNCHARSKQKRKKLRLKNFLNRVFEKRYLKSRPKFPGQTVYGDAIKVAVPLDPAFYRNGNRRDRTLNQRQKRKLAAQTR